MATRRTTAPARTAPTAPPAEKAAQSRRGTPLKAGEVSASTDITGASTAITVSADTRRAMIAQAAYLRAERRGFTSGGEEEDWLAAEAEVDALLRAGNGRPPQ
ncbi:MAG TPA: DUF2934 domain-containing protein [Steroidobacteraceae bacterium]|jgi:hypothetical protein|nr:DUF2934 domain-containing protein [Steroidobacteraceae bacterium]